MRRQLAVLVLAITVMIVVSFTIPLALLVQREAAEQAQVGAERDAQEVASLVALSTSTGIQPSELETAVGQLPTGLTIWLPDETVVGQPLTGQGEFAEDAIESLTPASGEIDGGGCGFPHRQPGRHSCC